MIWITPLPGSAGFYIRIIEARLFDGRGRGKNDIGRGGSKFAPFGGRTSLYHHRMTLG